MADKQRIVAEASAPDASVSEVARRHGVAGSLLYRWRKEISARKDHAKPVFLPISVELPPPLERASPEPTAVSTSMIEIVLNGGRVVRVDADVDTSKLAAIIAALEAIP
jgi:transposase